MFYIYLKFGKKFIPQSCLLAFFIIPQYVYANSLAQMDLESLMNLDVTTVSKRVQPLKSSAAAIYVITQEEIYRSGATSVPEALRLSPGVESFRANSSTWGVSIRGMNSIYAANLLVLIDGRSIYSPFYGGVYWDLVMPNLENIDRIEVIRGPGASLWGVNAVNGVVNIITKSSEVTQGYRATVSWGNEENHLRVRAGERVNNTFLRGYAGYKEIDSSKAEGSSQSANDAYTGGQFGGRIDYIGSNQKVTIQGDYATVDKAYLHAFSDQIGGSAEGFINTTWNVQSRLKRQVGSDELQVQAYIDHTTREEPGYEYEIDSYDVDLQYNHASQNGHQLTWGLNYRVYEDHMEGSSFVYTTKPKMSWDVYSAFIQDEWMLSDNLTWTLGTKVEKSELSDTAFQPSTRFIYIIDETFSYWGALSRAERIPTRIDLHLSYNYFLPEFWRDSLTSRFFNFNDSNLSFAELIDIVLTNPELILNPTEIEIAANLEGNDENYKNEEITTLELGFRWLPEANIFVDLTAHTSRHKNLRSSDFVSWDIDGNVINTELRLINKAKAETYGLEFALEVRPSENLRHKFHYNYLHVVVTNDTVLESAEFWENIHPMNQFSYKTYWDMEDSHQLDWELYYVSEIVAGNNPDPEEYVDMNIRYGWNVSRSVDLSFSIKNLFHKNRFEFQHNFIGPQRAEVGRRFALQLGWRY